MLVQRSQGAHDAPRQLLQRSQSAWLWKGVATCDAWPLRRWVHHGMVIAAPQRCQAVRIDCRPQPRFVKRIQQCASRWKL
eukprot:364643-Chlamydomonas_euryale.AAC.5